MKKITKINLNYNYWYIEIAKWNDKYSKIVKILQKCKHFSSEYFILENGKIL